MELRYSFSIILDDGPIKSSDVENIKQISQSIGGGTQLWTPPSNTINNEYAPPVFKEPPLLASAKNIFQEAESYRTPPEIQEFITPPEIREPVRPTETFHSNYNPYNEVPSYSPEVTKPQWSEPPEEYIKTKSRFDSLKIGLGNLLSLVNKFPRPDFKRRVVVNTVLFLSCSTLLFIMLKTGMIKVTDSTGETTIESVEEQKVEPTAEPTPTTSPSKTEPTKANPQAGQNTPWPDMLPSPGLGN
jgi:hypothetical protein